jgi:hypothetical protein
MRKDGHSTLPKEDMDYTAHETETNMLRKALDQGSAAKSIIDAFTKKDVPVSPLNPAHYRDGKIEVIEYIEDKNLGFNLGNAVKYISRAGKKDSSKTIEDLEKARWYLDREIENLKNASSS